MLSSPRCWQNAYAFAGDLDAPGLPMRETPEKTAGAASRIQDTPCLSRRNVAELRQNKAHRALEPPVTILQLEHRIVFSRRTRVPPGWVANARIASQTASIAARGKIEETGSPTPPAQPRGSFPTPRRDPGKLAGGESASGY